MWLDHYVSVPFKDGGRSFDGCDCFGLYMLLLENESGLKLADPGVSYGRSAAAVRAHIEAQMVSGDWIKIAEGDGVAVKSKASRFDLVIMSAHVRVGSAVIKRDVHVGCALGNGLMIHTEEGIGCMVVALDDPEVARRVKSVFRPKALLRVIVDNHANAKVDTSTDDRGNLEITVRAIARDEYNRAPPR